MKRLAALALIAVFAVSGCTLLSATGGGWMPNKSEEGNGKATFGFDIVCNESSGKLNGAWVYQDKASGVNAHGKLTNRKGGWFKTSSGTERGGVPCDMSGSPFYETSTGYLQLTYRAAPCPKDGSSCYGRGVVKIEDGDEIGRDKEDKLTVKFKSGPFAPYYNSKWTGGGNLVVVQED